MTSKRGDKIREENSSQSNQDVVNGTVANETKNTFNLVVGIFKRIVRDLSRKNSITNIVKDIVNKSSGRNGAGNSRRSGGRSNASRSSVGE